MARATRSPAPTATQVAALPTARGAATSASARLATAYIPSGKTTHHWVGS